MLRQELNAGVVRPIAMLVTGLAVSWIGGCGARTQLDLGAPATGDSNWSGTGGTSGSGGSGNQKKCDGSMVFAPVDKVDLLFMIDNSPSMHDKQRILAQAVPELVDRLVNPRCVDAQGNVGPAATPCPAGSTREFAPVNDIHIAVISSSLGGHGADLCSAQSAQYNPHQDDHAHLIPTVRTISGLSTYDNLGYLAWNPKDPAASGNSDELMKAFTSEVEAIGQDGCGFESQLEAWYRFLIEPDPPSSVAVSNNQAVVKSPDQVVLDQRKAFLRPDSLLTIIMITDEDDCSIADEGIGWIVADSVIGNSQFRMPPATSACATDPNSVCCRSCGVPDKTVPAGCKPIGQDPGCAAKTLPPAEDPLNLRCWDQKRRFGLDLLYPTSRYVTGLSAATIEDRSGRSVQNPLFTDLTGKGVWPRGPDMVFLAGIVGVPWQDIATPASLTGQGLRYLTASELAKQNRWNVILGNSRASPPIPPSDPYMIESNVPRSGNNPIVNVPIAPPDSYNPQASVINGHEYVPSPSAGDLEYACIFPLSEPKPCTAEDPNCDCNPDYDGNYTSLLAANRPVCQAPGGGKPVPTQYWAKAYPGLRELQVLKDLGNGSIVASICPKVLDSGDPDYGYSPAVWGIVDGLKNALIGHCVPRQ